MSGLLEDKHSIADVIHRYARSIDSKDFEALATCFTETAVGDYVGMTYVEGRDQIVEWVRSKVGHLPATMHVMTNVMVDVQGDTARSSCYGIAYLKMPSGPGPVLATRGLTYDDELQRCDGEWRISRRRHNAVFMTYAPEVSPDRLSW